MRELILKWIIIMATRHRKVIYGVTILLTLLLGAASGLLKMDTRWTELLPEKMPVAKEFRKIDDNFLQPQNMIVAIRGDDPVKLEKITDQVEARLKDKMLVRPGMSQEEIRKSERYARHVYGKLPEEWLNRNILKIIKPEDARRMSDLYRDGRILPFAIHLNDDLEREYTDSRRVKNQERQIVQSLDGIQRFVHYLGKAADGEVNHEDVRRVVRNLTVGRPYSFSLDNSISLVMVASALPSDDAEGMVRMDYRIEELLQPLQEKYPQYAIERTGMTAIARDEMDSVGPYTLAITVGALLLIFLALSWNYRSFLIPLLALTPIVIGIIWSMGLIGLTLGTLNLITSMMMVVLLGLGIDFTVHITSRFHEEMVRGSGIEEALRKTIASTGKGVVTGAFTTAVAFLAIMIADAKAIFQFGYCAGIGVLMTLAATMWLLPALLASRARRLEKTGRQEKESSQFTFLGSYVTLVGRRPLAVILLFVLLTAGGVMAGSDIKWEWNWMKLEPPNLRSIELQNEIVDAFKLSATPSLLTAESVEESRRLRKEFRDLRVVGEVNDISQWVSRPDYPESRAHLLTLSERIRVNRPSHDWNRKETRAGMADELDRLWANMVELQALSITGGQDRITAKTEQIVARRRDRDSGMLRVLADRFMEGDVEWKGVDAFARIFHEEMKKRVRFMSEDAKPVLLADVPEDMRDQFQGKDGDFLMHLMPTRNLFTKDALETFQSAVETVDEHVTGIPQLILAMNTSTLKEGGKAMVAAMIVIIIILMADFRRPLAVGMTILPVVVGVSLTLGIMWIFGEKFNFINMIGLPVILGIGVDDGVHLVHRYLDERDLRPSVVSVGRAMMMTSVTTMIGFGSLMFYLMRGMASMGFVLFVGVAMCYIVTVTFIPAVIERFYERKKR